METLQSVTDTTAYRLCGQLSWYWYRFKATGDNKLEKRFSSQMVMLIANNDIDRSF